MSERFITRGAALAGALAVTLSGSALAAQAKAGKPASSPSPVAVEMPKTDRMPMAYFKDLLRKGEVVVLDVRSHDSYLGGHIPGALSMPEDTINAAVAEKLKRMGKPIATYCS